MNNTAVNPIITDVVINDRLALTGGEEGSVVVVSNDRLTVTGGE